MDLNYKLKENDYLQLHLYFAKEDGTVRKEVITRFAGLFMILALISLFAYSHVDKNAFNYVISLGSILYLVFVSFRLKDGVFKMYQKHSKAYQNYFNKNLNLKIDNEYIYQIRTDVEVKNRISTIEKIIETGRYFYIKFPIGFIIIPKSEVENISQIQQELKNHADKLNVVYKTDLDWKW